MLRRRVTAAEGEESEFCAGIILSARRAGFRSIPQSGRGAPSGAKCLQKMLSGLTLYVLRYSMRALYCCLLLAPAFPALAQSDAIPHRLQGWDLDPGATIVRPLDDPQCWRVLDAYEDMDENGRKRIEAIADACRIQVSGKIRPNPP